MAKGSYKQFCPIAMASEIVCTRWTAVLLRELLMGSTRFNDLRRGVPRMSPALLSKRLKDLEEAGIVYRAPVENEPDVEEYILTQSGKDLFPVVESLGIWDTRWVETEPSLEHLDPTLLMWDIRRHLNTTPKPKKRATIQFIYSDLPKQNRNWWLIVEPETEKIDLCSIEPGFDVNLYISTDLRTMTKVWMGFETFAKAYNEDRILLTGDTDLEEKTKIWFSLENGLGHFSKVKKLVA
ncbi:MAG: helix-turn-helix domain-containing protein [Emcibacteraceae bacterium]